MDKKLVVLKAEQEAINDEIELNESLGARLANRIKTEALPTESSKYRVHVEEVGQITSLLVGLSGRLARIENTLFETPHDHPEKVKFGRCGYVFLHTFLHNYNGNSVFNNSLVR